MKHGFKDQHFRSLLKNTSYLGVSKIVAAIASVATLAFAGRGLGVILFGTPILITSYIKAVSRAASAADHRAALLPFMAPPLGIRAFAVIAPPS